MLQPSRRALVVIALASSAPAQAVLTVGPGGFADIQAAINAAANGDVIVVQGGAYPPFSLAKDLTITAAPGAVVEVAQAIAFSFGITAFQPPGEAHVSGLRFRNGSNPLLAMATRVTAGTVHFADCTFDSHRQYTEPALLVQNGHVVLQRCVAIGNGPSVLGTLGGGGGADAVLVSNGTLAAVDCLALGGDLGWDFTGDPGHALVVDAGRVQLANCSLFGGSANSLFPNANGSNGLRVVTDSQVWLADCQLFGGNGHALLGGSASVNLGATAVQHARTTFASGPGSAVVPATTGPHAAAPLPGLRAPTPAIPFGGTWTVGCIAPPATPVLLLWSRSLADAAHPLVAERLWLPPTAFGVAAAGMTDPTGAIDVPFAVPATPSLLYEPFFVQGFAGATLPLRATPPVGGTVR